MEDTPKEKMWPWAYAGTFQYSNPDPTSPSNFNKVDSEMDSKMENGTDSKTDNPATGSKSPGKRERDIHSKETSSQPEPKRFAGNGIDAPVSSWAARCLYGTGLPPPATTPSHYRLSSPLTPESQASPSSSSDESHEVAVDERFASHLKKDVAEGVRTTLKDYAVDPCRQHYLSKTAENLTPWPQQYRQNPQYLDNALKMEIEENMVTSMAASLRKAVDLGSSPPKREEDTTTRRTEDDQLIPGQDDKAKSQQATRVVPRGGVRSKLSSEPAQPSATSAPTGANVSEYVQNLRARHGSGGILADPATRRPVDAPGIRNFIRLLCRCQSLYESESSCPPVPAELKDGFVSLKTIKDQVKRYWGTLTHIELLETCNTPGNASNGGGRFETRTVSGEIYCRWVPEPPPQAEPSPDYASRKKASSSGAEQCRDCDSKAQSTTSRSGSQYTREIGSSPAKEEGIKDNKDDRDRDFRLKPGESNCYIPTYDAWLRIRRDARRAKEQAEMAFEGAKKADRACSRNGDALTQGTDGARDTVSATPSSSALPPPNAHLPSLRVNNALLKEASSSKETATSAVTAASPSNPPSARGCLTCDKCGGPVKADGRVTSICDLPNVKSQLPVDPVAPPKPEGVNKTTDAGKQPQQDANTSDDTSGADQPPGDDPYQIHPALKVAYPTVTEELCVFYNSSESPLYAMGSQRLDDSYHVVDTLKTMFKNWLVKQLWSVYGEDWCNSLLAERFARIVGWAHLTELVRHRNDDFHTISDRWWRETKGTDPDTGRPLRETEESHKKLPYITSLPNSAQPLPKPSSSVDNSRSTAFSSPVAHFPPSAQRIQAPPPALQPLKPRQPPLNACFKPPYHRVHTDGRREPNDAIPSSRGSDGSQFPFASNPSRVSQRISPRDRGLYPERPPSTCHRWPWWYRDPHEVDDRASNYLQSKTPPNSSPAHDKPQAQEEQIQTYGGPQSVPSRYNPIGTEFKSDYGPNGIVYCYAADMVGPSKRYPTQSVYDARPTRADSAWAELYNYYGTGNHAVQDYHMQLQLLEQQNKRRLELAGHRLSDYVPPTSSTPPAGRSAQSVVQGSISASGVRAPSPSSRKKGDGSSEPVPDGKTGVQVGGGGESTHAPHEYPAQLRLIEEENKQLRLLEEQRKKRLEEARQEFPEQHWPTGAPPAARNVQPVVQGSSTSSPDARSPTPKDDQTDYVSLETALAIGRSSAAHIDEVGRSNHACPDYPAQMDFLKQQQQNYRLQMRMQEEVARYQFLHSSRGRNAHSSQSSGTPPQTPRTGGESSNTAEDRESVDVEPVPSGLAVLQSPRQHGPDDCRQEALQLLEQHSKDRKVFAQQWKEVMLNAQSAQEGSGTTSPQIVAETGESVTPVAAVADQKAGGDGDVDPEASESEGSEGRSSVFDEDGYDFVLRGEGAEGVDRGVESTPRSSSV